MQDIFLDRYPQVDLHGLDRDSARMVTNDFVDENVFLGNEYVVIIHGIGSGILKKADGSIRNVFYKNGIKISEEEYNQDKGLINVIINEED